MLIKPLVLALALWLPCAMATTVTSHYSPIGGNAWSVEFTVLNDGPQVEVGGFTIYFPEATFTALSLEGSPGTWDALVIQPDLAIPSPGFIDAFAIDAADRLSDGESIDGFQVGFTFVGIGTPGPLAFDIVDNNFQVVVSGLTIVPGGPVNTVPSSGTLSLFALSVVASFGIRRWRAQKPSAC